MTDTETIVPDSIITGKQEAHIAVNRLRRAERLLVVLSRPEFAWLLVSPEALEILPTQGRDALAATIGMSPPSDVTWALLVELVRSGRTGLNT